MIDWGSVVCSSDLPCVSLVTLHQVHSAAALAVTAPFADDARPHADALVTDRPGLVLGILTAGCAPVLFADAGAGVVGAAHAGRSEEHTSELQSLMRISYADFCLKTQTNIITEQEDQMRQHINQR